ncbi:unnamed protein product, partial [Urochloa humidicola]
MCHLCLLFLTGSIVCFQGLYLDSIDLGVLNVDNCLLPRLRWFGPDRLISMIRADCVKSTNEGNVREFGKSKLLAPSKVCYSWADGVHKIGAQMRELVHGTITEASLLLADPLEAPMEEGANFFNTVCSYVGADNASRIGLAFVSIVGPYIRGRKISRVSESPSGFNGVVMSTGNVHLFQSGELCTGKRGKREVFKGDEFSDIARRMTYGVKKCRFDESYVQRCKGGSESVRLVPLLSKTAMSSAQDSIAAPSCFIEDAIDPWQLGFTFRYSREEAISVLADLFGDIDRG